MNRVRDQIKALVDVREKADDRVANQADVIGSMIGIKIVNGQPTDDIGLTYFVRKKLPQLSRRKRIPARMKVKNTSVISDVLEWPVMGEQRGHESIIFDGKLQGTLTCFGRSRLGVFGVSCAHCLRGIDGNMATPTNIALYSKVHRKYIAVGSSSYGVFSPGSGSMTNFGYLDCGLFDIHSPSLIARANAANTIQFVKDERSLLKKRLHGISSLLAPGGLPQERTGLVIGVQAVAIQERSDLVIAVDPPGTFQGDSGLLWLTEDGRAAAIHARGEVTPEHGSRLTTAMAARRAVAVLGVELAID